MKKIYIDSSKRKEKVVKLIQLKDGIEQEIDTLIGDIDIVAEVSNLLKKHNLTIQDIDDIYCFPGPGSFTGLKIGITVANILNWALDNKSTKELQLPKYGSEPNIQK